MKNKELKILLSAPRGFCAGVERAIEIVEKSIQKYGSPVYVRHEIVHNKKTQHLRKFHFSYFFKAVDFSDYSTSFLDGFHFPWYPYPGMG